MARQKFPMLADISSILEWIDERQDFYIYDEGVNYFVAKEAEKILREMKNKLEEARIQYIRNLPKKNKI